jgi:hypothetical protein
VQAHGAREATPRVIRELIRWIAWRIVQQLVFGLVEISVSRLLEQSFVCLTVVECNPYLIVFREGQWDLVISLCSLLS